MGGGRGRRIHIPRKDREGTRKFHFPVEVCHGRSQWKTGTGEGGTRAPEVTVTGVDGPTGSDGSVVCTVKKVRPPKGG